MLCVSWIHGITRYYIPYAIYQTIRYKKIAAQSLPRKNSARKVRRVRSPQSPPRKSSVDESPRRVVESMSRREKSSSRWIAAKRRRGVDESPRRGGVESMNRREESSSRRPAQSPPRKSPPREVRESRCEESSR